MDVTLISPRAPTQTDRTNVNVIQATATRPTKSAKPLKVYAISNQTSANLKVSIFEEWAMKSLTSRPKASNGQQQFDEMIHDED